MFNMLQKSCFPFNQLRFQKWDRWCNHRVPAISDDQCFGLPRCGIEPQGLINGLEFGFGNGALAHMERASSFRVVFVMLQKQP